MPLLALWLAFAQRPEPVLPPAPFDRRIALVLEERDSSATEPRRTQPVTLAAEFSGTLHAWTEAAGELDLRLRVETPSGALVGEDDDSGGGTTPYLRLEVEAGVEHVIVVSASGGAPSGELELVLVIAAAPETELTRAASERALAELAEVKRLRGTQDLAAARDRLSSALEDVLSVEGAVHSQLVCARSMELGMEAHALSLPSQAERALSAAYRHCGRTMPEEHPITLSTSINLAAALQALGDLRAARDHFERVVEARERTLPEDHPSLALARGNLAVTLRGLGDLAGALRLEERVLAVFTRTLPPDHPHLQKARLNLAGTLHAAGDFEAARVLTERALEVYSRALPEEHPELQRARANLAATFHALGDVPAARSLFERVLEVRSRTLPEDHHEVQSARLNLAATDKDLGDVEDARALEERAVEGFARTLPDDHPNLQGARVNLASTLDALGDLEGAREILERVVEARARTLSQDPLALQAARANLGAAWRALGDLERARALQEEVLATFERTLPDHHPALQKAREDLALTALASASRRASLAEPGKGPESDADRARGVALLLACSLAQSRAARELTVEAGGREAEARCASLSRHLDLVLSAALGYGGLAASAELHGPAFAYSESTRNVALSSSALARRAAGVDGYSAARSRLRSATDRLAGLVQAGTSGEDYRAALAERESAERALLALGRADDGKPTCVELDAASLSSALRPGEAAVAYRVYTRQGVEWPRGGDAEARSVPRETKVESVCAFVVLAADDASAVAAGDALHLIDLGPSAPLDEAVAAWRSELGLGAGRGLGVSPPNPASGSLAEAGQRLRRLAFEPLRPFLRAARRIAVVLDGSLQLVPLDALPSEGSGSGVLGDELRIETRLTLGELLDAPWPPSGASELLAVGGVDFDREHEAGSQGGAAPAPSATLAAAQGGASAHGPGILRGGASETRFEPLPATLQELDGLETQYRSAAGEDARITRLSGEHATREALLAAAPHARWLHVATHGWFASGSIRSWQDRDPLDRGSGLGRRLSSVETVKGMSPMLLCGLALAGANLPEDALGRARGLLTADELSTLDLADCELAVLSACDSARGELRRAGQGVASLQKALQIAGARSVLTSLWAVPDEPTKELMLVFYRQVWLERQPKWKALWEAKRRLREARDERGQPVHSVRDWAAWVLTGEPW